MSLIAEDNLRKMYAQRELLTFSNNLGRMSSIIRVIFAFNAFNGLIGTDQRFNVAPDR